MLAQRCVKDDLPACTPLFFVKMQEGRTGTIVGGSVGVHALLVDWDGMTDNKIATARVDCGGPISDDMASRGSLKWVACDDIEVLSVDIDALKEEL